VELSRAFASVRLFSLLFMLTQNRSIELDIVTPPKLSPVASLSKFQLTCLLLCFSIIPPAFVVSMVLFFPASPELKLEAAVRFDVSVIRPRKDPENPRILPSVVIKNPTEEVWNRIAVSINKDFFFYRPDSLKPKEEFSVPLEFFVTKSGNVAFQPGSEWVQRVTVYAQVPSAARAVSENYFNQKGEPIEAPKKTR
jgi:hypothetical protein